MNPKTDFLFFGVALRRRSPFSVTLRCSCWGWLAAGRWIVIALSLCLPAPAQWKALGPFGGSAALVQVDPHESGVVIAGTSNGRLFRSMDGGENWDALPFPHNLRTTLHAFLIHPETPNVYFAGISSGSPASSGLLRSIDGGASWQPVPAFYNITVRAISIFRADSQLLAVGTNIGVFQSNDGGDQWSRISPAENVELQPVVSLAFDAHDPEVMYAGTPHLPWKTSDGGETWHSIHLGMVDDSDVFSLVVDRNRRQRVLAGACSGIYRSFDGGSSWMKLRDARVNSHRVYTIAQHPQYEDVVFAGSAHGMMRSRNGGEKWEKLVPYATRSIAFDLRQLGRVYIATDEAGILRSEDNGKTWQQTNHGFSNRNLASLVVDHDGAVYTSTFADSSGVNVFRLANDEDEWSKVATVPQFAGEPLIAVAALLSEEKIYAATARFILVSDDGGARWARLTEPLTQPSLMTLFSGARQPGVRDRTTTDAAVALDLPWIPVVAGVDMFASAPGESWNTQIQVPGEVKVHGIVQVATKSLLAATSAGLRLSQDLGASWRSIGGSLAGSSIQAICRHPLRASLVFAAHQGLIYKSEDGGRSWSPILSASPIDSVKQLVVSPGTPDRLFVLTRQHGVFTLLLNLATGLEPSTEPSK